MRQDEYTEQLILRLGRLYPEGLCRMGIKLSFGISLPQDDPRCIAILDELRSAGLRPCTDRTRQRIKGVEYTMYYIREYDESDYESASLLLVRPHVNLKPVSPKTKAEALGRDRVHVALEDIDPSFDFMYGEYCHIIVPRRVRLLLDQAELLDVNWLPVGVWDTHKTSRGRLDADSFWELSGQRVLPPMSPSVELYDARTEQRVTPGHPDPVLQMEGLYGPTEPRYRAADLQAFGPFDVARTFEKPFPTERHRRVIVSNRFYRFCREHGLKTGFVPVRIDEQPQHGPTIPARSPT